MRPSSLYLLAALALFAIGLHGLFAHAELMRKVLAANVTAAGAFLLLVALARRGDGPPDPVPHAMVLTGIVIAVSVSAFALALARRLHHETGATRLDGDDEDEPR